MYGFFLQRDTICSIYGVDAIIQTIMDMNCMFGFFFGHKILQHSSGGAITPKKCGEIRTVFFEIDTITRARVNTPLA